ncbi:unnamed protein product [Chrysoparadoxa australica]
MAFILYAMLVALLAATLTVEVLCMNPMELNGGSCMAMKGRDCVALVVDKRFGVGEQLVSDRAERVLKVNDRLMASFTGLTTDVQTLMDEVMAIVRAKRLEEGTPITPLQLSHLVSSMLYSRRSSPYFCEPVIAGLDAEGVPHIFTQDVLGATTTAEDFVVSGSSSQGLYGICEANFQEGLEADELFQVRPGPHCINVSVALIETRAGSRHLCAMATYSWDKGSLLASLPLKCSLTHSHSASVWCNACSFQTKTLPIPPPPLLCYCNCFWSCVQVVGDCFRAAVDRYVLTKQVVITKSAGGVECSGVMRIAKLGATSF